MEIINIEKQTFEEMMLRFDAFSQWIEAICSRHGNKKLDKWLDNQDVCFLLNISPRTLQTYRDTGKISFSQINRKMYYKSSDVEKLLKTNESTFNPKTK